MSCTCYSKGGKHIIFLGGDVEGNEDLFAVKAFAFCIRYLEKHQGKQSKSLRNAFAQWIYDAIGRLTDDKIYELKTQDNNDNEQNQEEKHKA